MEMKRLGLMGAVLITLFVAAGCGKGGDEGGGGGSPAIEPQNTAPAIVSAPERFAKENTPYSYKVRAVDPENDSLQYSLKTAPVGMGIDPTTGEISWTPMSAQGGEHPVEVSVSDSHQTGSQDFTVKVQTGTVVVSKTIVAAEGGTIEVTDPASPIFGTKVEISPGILPQDATITISSVSFPTYLPETVPVIEIKGNLPAGSSTAKSNNLQGFRSAPISAHTTIIIPFPSIRDGSADKELKLYRFQTVAFCKIDNIEKPEDDPFACVHGTEIKKLWKEVDSSSYSKDMTRRMFTYFLEATSAAESLRAGDVLQLAAATPAQKSAQQLRFFEVIRPANPEGKTRNVVLLHGICSSSDNFRETNGLIDFIRNDSRSPYLNAYFYNYPWGELIEDNGNELINAINALSLSGALSSSSGSVDIIAHSMGGAVARWAIEDPISKRGVSSKISNLFMLATPNWGVFREVRGSFLPSCSLNWGEPNKEDSSLDELIEGSDFLTRKLNSSDAGSAINRRGGLKGTSYYLFTAKTLHLGNHPVKRWADHIHFLSTTDFVPVPNEDELNSLGLIQLVSLGKTIPRNSALTFDGELVGVPLGTTDTPLWYDHVTIHTQCSRNLVCEAIVRAIRSSSSETSSPPPPDIIPPDTTIDSGLPTSTTSSMATFTFHSTESGSTFECKLDAGSFTPCSSPQTYSGLAVGSHTFSVRATNVAGNTDPTPAIYIWQVNIPSAPVITGVVRDRNTGLPIQNARVFFYGSAIGTVFTDASGKYTFTASDLRSFGGGISGTLYVGVTGYFEAPPIGISDLSTQPSLPVVRDISLLPGGIVVRGTVRDASTGLGISGAVVNFNRNPMSTFLGGGTTESVQTNADGSYSIDSSYFNESGLSSGFSTSLMVNVSGYLGATKSISFASYPVTQDFNLLSP